MNYTLLLNSVSKFLGKKTPRLKPFHDQDRKIFFIIKL